MKLRSLAVNQFKKFTCPQGLAGIGDNLNVIVGPNEMGKSTLLDALRAVLFEKYRSKAEPIRALQNVRNRAAPVVRLEFELDAGIYRVTKRFMNKPYARLSCPDGRSLEGDAAEETLRGLLGSHQPGNTGAKPETLGKWSVLWVQQGQSFGALNIPKSAQSSLHAALESEVGAVLGGHRGRALPLVIEKRVTENVLNAILSQAKEVERVRNRLSAAATVITFDMTREDMSGIDVDGEPLIAERSPIQAFEPVSIAIPERGKIIVVPAIKDRDKLLRRRRDSATILKEKLESAGVESLADAEDRYAKRQRLLGEADFARQVAELHAPASSDHEAGAQALGDHIEGLRQVLNREMDKLALSKLPARAEAEAALKEAQGQADRTRANVRAARAALSGPEKSLSELQSEIGNLQGRYDVGKDRLENLRVQVAREEADRSDTALQSAIDDARVALSRQETAIKDLESQRTDETLPQLKARIERLESAQQARQEKRVDLRIRIAGFKSSVEAAEGAGLDEAIAEKTRDLNLIEEEKIRLDREVQILSLLLTTLRNAEREAKVQYLSPVLTRVQPYLQLLFPGALLRIDENLHITGMVREAGYEEKFDHLSMGTREQIAVLVRIAFAEMLVEQGHPAAIVLDDALVFSDDRRMSRVFDILNIAARNIQVIVFTCREQVFEGLGGRRLALDEPERGEELASA